MKAGSKRSAAKAAAVIIAGISLGTLALARKHKKRLPKVVPIESQISVQNGETVITVPPEAQKLAGIVAAPLRKASAHRQIAVPAEVLSVEDLAKLHKSYTAAQAQLAKSRAKADVSRKRYKRLKSRNRHKERDDTQKSLQSAKDALHSDEADIQMAQQELALVAAMAKQNWGGEVAQWLENGNPLLERVLARMELLLEVIVPSGESVLHPSHIQVQMPGGHFSEAELVSADPKAGPHKLGTGFLYCVPAPGGVDPGAKLTARLRVEGMSSGAIVPSSAVVWAEGKSWVYLQNAPNRFLRRPVELSQPEGKDFFVSQGISPGDQVVVQGAQILFSVEFHFEIQPAR